MGDPPPKAVPIGVDRCAGEIAKIDSCVLPFFLSFFVRGVELQTAVLECAKCVVGAIPNPQSFFFVCSHRYLSFFLSFHHHHHHHHPPTILLTSLHTRKPHAEHLCRPLHTMANRRSKHPSLSSEISKLTAIATRMGSAQGEAAQNQDKDQLGTAIQRIVDSALRMGGITGQGMLNPGAQMGETDDDDSDSDSSDDSDWDSDTDSDSGHKAKPAVKKSHGSKRPASPNRRKEQSKVQSESAQKLSGAKRPPGVRNAVPSSERRANIKTERSGASDASFARPAANERTGSKHPGRAVPANDKPSLRGTGADTSRREGPRRDVAAGAASYTHPGSQEGPAAEKKRKHNSDHYVPGTGPRRAKK